MKLDNDIREAVRSIISNGIYNYRNKTIDISKMLDEDNKIDLWLLEVSIRSAIQFIKHYTTNSSSKPYIFIANYNEYRKMRDIIPGSPKDMEELTFIVRFKDSIILDELS